MMSALRLTRTIPRRGWSIRIKANYASNFGRFMSVDQYKASAGPTEPMSWNRYAYALTDPNNLNDPSGRLACDPDLNDTFCGTGDDFIAGSGAPADPADLALQIMWINFLVNGIVHALDAANPWNPAQGQDIDCTIQEWYRPVVVAGKATNNYHIILITIIHGILTTYEGEPNPSPALPNSFCDPATSACPSNSLLAGVTIPNPNATGGLGKQLASLMGPWLCPKIGAIATANTAYNRHQLHYVINGQPNSNSYAFTMLSSAGLLFPGSPFGPPPVSVPGWGYNVLTNPEGYQ